MNQNSGAFQLIQKRISKIRADIRQDSAHLNISDEFPFEYTSFLDDVKVKSVHVVLYDVSLFGLAFPWLNKMMTLTRLDVVIHSLNTNDLLFLCKCLLYNHSIKELSIQPWVTVGAAGFVSVLSFEYVRRLFLVNGGISTIYLYCRQPELFSSIANRRSSYNLDCKIDISIVYVAFRRQQLYRCRGSIPVYLLVVPLPLNCGPLVVNKIYRLNQGCVVCIEWANGDYTSDVLPVIEAHPTIRKLDLRNVNLSNWIYPTKRPNSIKIVEFDL